MITDNNTGIIFSKSPQENQHLVGSHEKCLTKVLLMSTIDTYLSRNKEIIPELSPNITPP